MHIVLPLEGPVLLKLLASLEALLDYEVILDLIYPLACQKLLSELVGQLIHGLLYLLLPNF